VPIRSALAAAAALAVSSGGVALGGAAIAAPASPGHHAAPRTVELATKQPTKTTAALQDGYVFGRVTVHGKGVQGLKVRVQRKAGSKWQTYATVTTKNGGGYSAPLVRTGTYRAVTLATAKYRGSTSKPVST
jgi:hypothetical protein